MSTFLIIRPHYKFITFLFLTSIFSCQEESPKPVQDSNGINSVIESAGTLPPPPKQEIRTYDTSIISVMNNGIPEKCTTYMVERTDHISDFSLFYTQNQSDIFPGNLIKSKDIKENGRPTSIGNFTRGPGYFTIRGSQGTKSFKLENPSSNFVNEAITRESKFFWFMPPIYNKQETEISFSSEQACIELGLNLKFLTGGLKTSFTNSSINENQELFMLVKTIYFDVSIEYPTSPSAFFGVNVNAEDLKRVVTTDNPLAYISKVSYGRIALVKFKSKYKQKEVKKAVQLKLGIVNGDLTVKDEQVISDLSLTIESAPGFDKTIRTMDDIIEFLDNGAEYHHRNGFVPVSFNTNYTFNNDPLATHSFTEYKVNLCEY